MSALEETRTPQIPFWNDPKTRSTAVQIIMVAVLVAVAYELYVNASANLANLSGIGKTMALEYFEHCAHCLRCARHQQTTAGLWI